jgi:fructoselysine-6-P-deglycase FrlB-like protein
MMDEKTEKMLRELYRVSRENNDYLQKIDRRQRYGIYWNVFLMILAVGSALGIYYFAQPYLEQLVGFYNQFGDSLNQFNIIPESLRGLTQQ